MKKTMVEYLEIQEQIQKLKEKGFSNIVEKFIDNEAKVYTKKGRLNKSGACRILGCKPKELEELLRLCREALGIDDL